MNNATIDIAAIRQVTKQAWLKERRRKVSFLDRVEQSVPWWLVIVAATLFILSAPHTASTFARLTPVLGVIAPFGVEFGLLYAAFIRKQLKQRKERVPIATWALELLLFFMAIVVNAAGSFTAVVSGAAIDSLSFVAMLERFKDLPATAQVALTLVPIAALMIPLGTVVAGEGLAALVLERHKTQDGTEDEWRAIEKRLLREAFFDALIAAGETPGHAHTLAKQYAGIDVRDNAVTPSVSSVSETPETKKHARSLSAPAQVAYQWFGQYPNRLNESHRDLATEIGTSESTVYRVQQAIRKGELPLTSSGNGHSHNEI